MIFANGFCILFDAAFAIYADAGYIHTFAGPDALARAIAHTSPGI